MLAPIIVAPIADQRRFHPDGEAATIQGASPPRRRSSSAAIHHFLSRSSSRERPARSGIRCSPPTRGQAADARSGGPRLPSDLPDRRSEAAGAWSRIGAGVGALDWAAVGALASGSRVPVIVRGVMTAADAKAALRQNVQGVMVSDYAGVTAASGGTLTLLPPIVDAVAGRVPVLVDGSFRRGTDILKALAFGAQAVAVGRPVMWGLAAYGADGVQGVLEMLQTELARYMAMCGRTRRRDVEPRPACACMRSRRRRPSEQEPRGFHRKAMAAQPSRRQAIATLAGLVAASPLFGSRARRSWIHVRSKDHKRLPGLDEMMDAFDFEPLMFANVPLSVYDYTAHGDGSEFTLRRNRQAFDWVDLVRARRSMPPAWTCRPRCSGCR